MSQAPTEESLTKRLDLSPQNLVTRFERKKHGEI